MQTAIEKIRELRTLHEDGLLSRDEFDRRKEAILDNAYHDARAQASKRSEGTELGLMAGQEVGQPARRYRLQRLIAHGGMTEVWQAVDLATEAQLGHGAQVALKIHPPQRAGAAHEARLLLEEAICARRLTHEHIVRVHDWSQDAATGSLFLVMEYLDGENLDSLVARTGGLPLERALALLEPVGQALDYAWDKHRLVHRDLKPANVFLHADGTIKLLDFGIAGSAVHGGAAPGNSGTAAYRAPEAADPQLAPDRALDVHAAAVMLYRMATGALPFDGKRREQAAPRENALPDPVRAALHAGFAPDPSMRPPSVSALLARVREAMTAPLPIVAAEPAKSAPEPARPAAPAIVTPLRAATAPDPVEQRRELERRARATVQAEREARRQALREQLRRRLEQDAEQDRIAARSRPAQRRAELLASVVAAPFVAAGEQVVNSRLAYAATGTVAPTAAPRPAAAQARSDESGQAPPRGRLRDRFLDDSSQSPELVVLAPGRFLMGSGPAEQQAALDAGARKAWLDREGPRHAVTIAKPFAISRLPVTVGQWREFVLGTSWKSGGEVSWAAPGFMQTDDHPVVGISWHDTQLYVRWLSTRTGKRYRLPTEAEWEYACRAGTSTPFNLGENIRPDQANYDARFAWSGNERGVPRRGTTAAGSYPANAWGLCDMHGNVWEWVQDVMHDSYDGAPTDGSAWEEGGDQNRRVLRGGSWLYHPRYLRSAVRNGFASRLSNDKVGLRIVREVE